MKEIATFAAGCFWGVENAFRKLPGVISTRVGYIGGKTESPTYNDICSGGTGHHEGVEVIFDTNKITYEDLLKKFWSVHDPTTRNRQGLDLGEQYHSVIFYHTEEQEKMAKDSKRKQDDLGVFKKPIVTDIEPASKFYEAEKYHQQYIEKTGHSTCDV